MTKTNKESFIEVECSEFNERNMHENKLQKSPGLKIQIFLNNHSAKSYVESREARNLCTSIACDAYSNESGRCIYSSKPCKYNYLMLKNNLTQ